MWVLELSPQHLQYNRGPLYLYNLLLNVNIFTKKYFLFRHLHTLILS
jgi:hypothetical protein